MSVARVWALPGLGGMGGLRAEFAAGTETPHPPHRKKQALPPVHPNPKPWASPSTGLSDDGLSAGLDLDLLDPDHLFVAPLHPIERLHRALKRSLQPRDRGRKIHHPTITSARLQATEHVRAGRVQTGRVDGQRRLRLVLRPETLNERKRGPEAGGGATASPGSIQAAMSRRRLASTKW